MKQIGIIGSGTMGSGIAQLAAMAGNDVVIFDTNHQALIKARDQQSKTLNMLAEKGKISNEESIACFSRLHFAEHMPALRQCHLIIEAIVEQFDVKKTLFSELDLIVNKEAIIASNTSSFSITALASSIENPSRFIGLHFFNPAPVMQLVEIIPAIQTNPNITSRCIEIIQSWGKTTVLCKDSPGFIVNRIARPYYSEAIRIFEEGIANIETIDFAMTDTYGFKMGPFALMDFIGHDVNFNVTKSVWESCYFEDRYKPSITQRNLLYAGWLGKKSGKGFYDYSESDKKLHVKQDRNLLESIAWRILLMLINEAADAWYYNIASKKDIDLAMTKGVNYPKGLLAWGEEIGYDRCVAGMKNLYNVYNEDRYRCSPGLHS